MDLFYGMTYTIYDTKWGRDDIYDKGYFNQ